MTTARSFDDTTPLARSDDALSAPLEDKLLMLSVAQGSYFEFSPVTRRIWELLETSRSVSELVAQLIGEYEVAPDVCRSEVRTVIESLMEEGLVATA